MKKYMLLALLCAGAATVQAQTKGKAGDRAEIRKSFTTSCVESATANLEDPGMRPYMVKFCDCSADKVLAKFSDEEIEGFAEMDKAEIQEKMMPVIEDCTKKLTADLDAYAEKPAGKK